MEKNLETTKPRYSKHILPVPWSFRYIEVPPYKEKIEQFSDVGVFCYVRDLWRFRVRRVKKTVKKEKKTFIWLSIDMSNTAVVAAEKGRSPFHSLY